MCYFGLRMGKMIINCAAGRHVKHPVCFLLTMKMLKIPLPFPKYYKAPKSRDGFAPIHLSLSYPPASSENPSPTRIVCYFRTSQSSPSPVLGFKRISFQTHHFYLLISLTTANRVKKNRKNFILCSLQKKWRVSLRLVLLFAMWSHSFQLPLKTER